MDTQRIDIPILIDEDEIEQAHATGRRLFDFHKTLVTLRVLDGGEGLKDSLLVLQSGLNVVGRDLGCDIHILHPTISRRHCTIDLNELGMSVIDMQSLHGVIVNGRLLNVARLMPRDIIQLGEVRFVVETRMRQGCRPEPRVELRRCAPVAAAPIADKDTKLVAQVMANLPLPGPMSARAARSSTPPTARSAAHPQTVMGVSFTPSP